MRYIYWVLVLVMLTSSSCIFGQSRYDISDPVRIIPPSPEASRFALYGQYDISPYTGKPQIEVPLYTIKTSRHEVSLSLDYEGTAIRTDDLASWTGTGWVLNGGGIITRVVVGLPDDGLGGFLSQTNIPYEGQINIDYYDKVVYYKSFETEPDKYFYNVNGLSGEFTFDASKKIIQTPVSGLKISRAGNGFEILDEQGTLYEFKTAEYSMATVDDMNDVQPYSPSSWWLTKISSPDKGDAINFYYTEDKGITGETEEKRSFSAYYGPKYSLQPGVGQNDVPFGLYEMTSDVEYSSPVTVIVWYPQRLDSIVYTNGKVVLNRVKDRLDGGSSRLASVDVYNRIQGVYGKLKSIKFITDYFHYTGPVSFGHASYADNSGRHRLKLVGLENQDAQGAVINRYGFKYNESIELPFRSTYQQDYWGYYNGADINDIKLSLIPAQSTWDYRYTVGYANRSPNETFMKAGMLLEIVHPTGGFTRFNWEAHRYLYSGEKIVSHPETCIAFGNNQYNMPRPTVTSRSFTLPATDNVKVTVNIPGYTTPNPPYDNPDYQELAETTRPNVAIIDEATGQKVFSDGFYTHENTPYNRIVNLSLPAGTYHLIANCYINNVVAQAEIDVEWHTRESVNDVRMAGGLRIAKIQNYDNDGKFTSQESFRYGLNESGYGKLALPPEYLTNLSYQKDFNYYWSSGKLSCAMGSTTRTIYSSEPLAGIGMVYGSSVTYPVVTRYFGDNGTNNGKTIYHFRGQQELDMSSYFDYKIEGEYIVRKLGWVRPRVEHEEVYSQTASGYRLINDTFNEYIDFAQQSMPVIRLGFRHENVSLNGCFLTNSNDYYKCVYYLKTAVTQLTSSRQKVFDLSGHLITDVLTSYTYDNTYYSFPVNKTITNSKGETLLTTNKYPFDKNQISGLSAGNALAIDRMLAKNMIAHVLEKENFKNNERLQKVRTNYRIWDVAQNIVMPESVELQIQKNPSEIRMVYEAYDSKGNLLRQLKANDVLQSYLWDYSGAYPIAQVVNAIDPNIAYTSFEAEGTGNWTVPSSDRDYLTTTISGRSSYSLRANTPIRKTGLTGSVTYVVSYWRRNGADSYAVSGSTAVSKGETIKGWTYYEHTVSGVTEVLVSGSSGNIDELRLYPKGSQMTTYTYTPQVGVTCMADVNNVITYYEYDPFGRLRLVSNNKGNILKKYSYHFKQ